MMNSDNHGQDKPMYKLWKIHYTVFNNYIFNVDMGLKDNVQ